MFEKYFNLEKQSNIWIYGYGRIGTTLARHLRNCNYNVEGFIDRNAHLHSLSCENGEEIYTLCEFAKRCPNKDSIIFVALRNANQHDQVAGLLYENNYDKIIYLPMRGGGDLRRRSIRRQIYREFCDSRFERIKDVPVYCENDRRDIIASADKWPVVAATSADKVTFWCPVSALRSSSVDEMCKVSGRDLKLMYQYSEFELKYMTPYMNLFRWLEGDKSADVTLYCKYSERENQDESNVLLEDRKALYQTFEWAYRYEMSFFVDSASTCKWNAKGYFNVLDGLHRIFYLMFKGRKEVPVEVTNADWNKYVAWIQKALIS